MTTTDTITIKANKDAAEVSVWTPDAETLAAIIASGDELALRIWRNGWAQYARNHLRAGRDVASVQTWEDVRALAAAAEASRGGNAEALKARRAALAAFEEFLTGRGAKPQAVKLAAKLAGSRDALATASEAWQRKVAELVDAFAAQDSAHGALLQSTVADALAADDDDAALLDF